MHLCECILHLCECICVAGHVYRGCDGAARLPTSRLQPYADPTAAHRTLRKGHPYSLCACRDCVAARCAESRGTGLQTARPQPDAVHQQAPVECCDDHHACLSGASPPRLFVSSLPPVQLCGCCCFIAAKLLLSAFLLDPDRSRQLTKATTLAQCYTSPRLWQPSFAWWLLQPLPC